MPQARITEIENCDKTGERNCINGTASEPNAPVNSDFAVAILPPADITAWQLYGTLGCHLCDEAENLLKQAQRVAHFSYEKIDIMDLPEAQMQGLAEKIPVLVTPQQTLSYPFSIMDIMALVASQ